KPGTKITLEVLRDNKAIALEAEVGNFPSDKVVTPEAAQEATKYGFSVEALTPELARKYGYQNDTGVVITQVESGSVAAWAGLRAGTLIMAINRQPVKSLEDY